MAQTQLSDLPNELITQICSFVPPVPSDLSLINLAGRPNEDQAWAADRESRAALLSLGLSCRRFSTTVIPEIYRTVRIGLPGRGRFPGVAAKNDTVRLLKTLQLNSRARRSVKQLWIYAKVAHGQTYQIYYNSEDVKVLRESAEAVGISWPMATPGLFCGQSSLGLAIFVLLSHLESVEQLGLSLDTLTFNIVRGWLRWRKPPLRLKNLFLIARPAANGEVHEPYLECFSTFSLMSSSSMFVQGMRLIPEQSGPEVSNLTSIRLASVDIDVTHLTKVIRDCRKLLTFWLMRARDLAHYPARPDAAIVVDALKQHADTLEDLSLILGFNKLNRTIEDGGTRRVTSLSSFRKLKVLRMDDKVFESGQRDVVDVGNRPHVVSAARGFVGSLPPSLEHLELYWTKATHAVDDLRCLDLNRSSGLLPALRKVYIQQFIPPLTDLEESLRARGVRVVRSIKW